MGKKSGAVSVMVFLLLASCESQRPLIVPETVPEEDVVINGWMSLSDGAFHADAEGLTPEGYYVRGERRSWQTFHPTSEILGKGKDVPETGEKQPAWIELDDGSLHPVKEGFVPRPPFVRGYLDQDGRFYPEPKKIVR